ncbi:MAG: RdgB/HAM1 family non-canonical purine NTP pyrophosphatase [Oligoflexia bacterium]|nr:RdgB/HAM1 family non-canonical purine NTP pyrophosphatase [Oligoflexia bacterium]
MQNKTLWVATHNKNKLKEIKDIFKDTPFEVHGAFEISHYSPPNETGKTFQENAQIKARFLKAIKPQDWVLSDDSGLEVTALKMLPGVHSARYAGPTAKDIENTTKLLKMLQIQATSGDRSAQFKCVMCLISPNGEEKFFEGYLKGNIASTIKGLSGFGYDPVFIPQGQEKTLAELGLAFKNSVSHRFMALKEVIKYLKSL